jgi:hypothetical protein
MSPEPARRETLGSQRAHDFFNRLPAFGFHVNRVYFRIADADLIYVGDLQNRLYEVVQSLGIPSFLAQ